MRPELPQVTLVAVTSVALVPTVNALRASMAQAHFGRVLLLSDTRPPAAEEGIEYRPIEALSSRNDYSRFMLRHLAQYIETEYALCVQWDGFVLRGDRWDPTFLDFDYIGAPWPHFRDSHNVGNGGFSLRSRRLLEACRNLPFDGTQSEDVVISRLFRSTLEKQGLRFAPEPVAREFAYERTPPTGREFGFHGSFNLVRYLSSGDAARLFDSLEARMLARSERWEIFRWAATHGRVRLASSLLRSLFG